MSEPAAEGDPSPEGFAPAGQGRQRDRDARTYPAMAQAPGDRPPRPAPYAGPGGFLLLDKPPGVSSFQALRPVKRLFPKAKVGHAGTLDPAASGLLIAGIAGGTRLLEYLEGMPKTYAFTAHFGFTSDTYDCEGRIAPAGGRPAGEVTAPEIEKALEAFRGRIRQAPPAYSAIKVDGERAYALARAGEEVVLAAREVEIHGLELRSFGPGGAAGHSQRSASTFSTYPTGSPMQAAGRPPADGTNSSVPAGKAANPAAQPASHGPADSLPAVPGLAEAPFAELIMTCSKGTYVRSLVHDLGKALGCGAVTGSLRRLAIGPFRVENALAPDALGRKAAASVGGGHAPESGADAPAEPPGESLLLPLETAVADLPAVRVPPRSVGAFLNGGTVTVELPQVPGAEARREPRRTDNPSAAPSGAYSGADSAAAGSAKAGRDGFPGVEVRAHDADGRLLAIARLDPDGRCAPRKVLSRGDGGNRDGRDNPDNRGDRDFRGNPDNPDNPGGRGSRGNHGSLDNRAEASRAGEAL